MNGDADADWWANYCLRLVGQNGWGKHVVGLSSDMAGQLKTARLFPNIPLVVLLETKLRVSKQR